jgi:hypothetical protein
VWVLRKFGRRGEEKRVVDGDGLRERSEEWSRVEWPGIYTFGSTRLACYAQNGNTKFNMF